MIVRKIDKMMVMNKQRKMIKMISWSAHLVPEKNAIHLYRRTDDLTQVRNPEATNKRVIEHPFKNLHRDEIFEAATKALQEKGYAAVNKWKRDQNFDIWYSRVVESTDEIVEPIDEPII